MNARCFLSHVTGCVSTPCARDYAQVQPSHNKGKRHLLCTTYTHAPTHPKRTKYHQNNAHRITSHRQKNSDTRPSILRTPPRREYRMLFADFAVKVADQLQPHCSPRFSRLTRPLLFSPGELQVSARGLLRVSHVSASRSFASRAHVNQPAARISIDSFRYLLCLDVVTRLPAANAIPARGCIPEQCYHNSSSSCHDTNREHGR